MGELVAGPDDEIFESVIGIQVGVEKTSMFRAAFMRRASQELIRSIFENVSDLVGFAEKVIGEPVYQAEVMEGEPILEIGIGNFDVEAVTFLSDVDGGIEPSLVTVPVDFMLDGFFDKKPRVSVLFVLHVIT
jgi:hypothetical protein